MLFHEGAGADAERSGWRDLFEAAISDADFRDERREYSEFAIASKEELFFMRTLAANMDVKRVPHCADGSDWTCRAPQLAALRRAKPCRAGRRRCRD